MGRSLTVCLAICVLAVVGFADAPDKRAPPAKTIAEELSSAETIELLALDPKVYEKEDGDKEVRLFHKYRVLGALAVRPEEKCKSVREGICNSLSDDRSIRALCFHPRHGIIAKKGKTVVCEALICFECQVAELYDGEKYRGAISIKKGFGKQLDKLLADNKIPVAD